MCGIIGYVGSQYQASRVVLDGLERLEYRGYDSAGLAAWQDGELVVRRDKGKLKKIRPNLEKGFAEDNRIAIGHTRWATHGKPTEYNAHPHMDNGENIVIVHNGIIENYLELKSILTEKGHQFKSETDTEIIVHLLAECLKSEPDFLQAVFNALEHLEGAYALAVINKMQPDRIYVAKKNCPVIVGVSEDEGGFITSDRLAVLRYTRQLVFMEDYQVGVVFENHFDLYDSRTRSAIDYEIERVDWDPATAEKEGYKHFMLKEIHEQPSVFRNTIGQRTNEQTGEVVLGGLNLGEDELKNIHRIQIVACGTAYYSGLVGKYVIEKLARVPVEVLLASEFRYSNPVCDEHTLVVGVSQSGETADTIAAIELARSCGAQTMAIVNVQGSTITRKVHGVLYIHAGPEIGVASTKAYMAMLVAFELFGLWLAQKLGRISEDYSRRIIHELKVLPQKMEEILRTKEEVLKVAQKYKDYLNFLFLGRDLNYPTALEGALKLKEISYIHAEGYAAGEMKHGPIALLDKNCPVVAIMTGSSVYDKTLSNVVEARSRDCRVLALISRGDSKARAIVDDIMVVPDTEEILSPLLNVLPLQLFAYYVADLKGADVDQPRNLAKSVTVE
jgi:glucosamine--fructose-6-phosphate aminotransferase (isomerizing)